jgi:hypothetical protein
MPGQPGIGTGTGGRITAINNLGTALMPLVAVNPYREFIQFANPGNVTIFVAMALDANGNPLQPSTLALGGTLPVLTGATLTVVGECQQGWNGFAASGSNNPITVFESNLS